jgi:uncharacterized coiled-coil protein SlyX
MELLQDQVSVLNEKVDAIQQMIERLSLHVTEILSELRSLQEGRTKKPMSSSRFDRYSDTDHIALDDGFEQHKDVLSDHRMGDGDFQGSERLLSPEVQIQRLTAQLTASYNRIAALEEQLLSHRIH